MSMCGTRGSKKVTRRKFHAFVQVLSGSAEEKGNSFWEREEQINTILWT